MVKRVVHYIALNRVHYDLIHKLLLQRLYNDRKIIKIALLQTINGAPMSLELFFIYDSHCPWSYATTPLVNELREAYPDMDIKLLHCAHYDGSDSAGQSQIDAVKDQSSVKFGREHLRFANSPKNATMTANIMAWVQAKQPAKALDVLNSIQQAHYIDGSPLGYKNDFADILEEHRLSAPNKVFKEELSSDAAYVVEDIAEMQEFIGTTAFPAMLLVSGDNAVLLNHQLYLNNPQAIVEAVKLELK